jgi:hypothetical protein
MKLYTHPISLFPLRVVIALHEKVSLAPLRGHISNSVYLQKRRRGLAWRPNATGTGIALSGLMGQRQR